MNLNDPWSFISSPVSDTSTSVKSFFHMITQRKLSSEKFTKRLWLQLVSRILVSAWDFTAILTLVRLFSSVFYRPGRFFMQKIGIKGHF